VRRPITTVHREVREYHEIAENAGWRMVEEFSLIVPASIVALYPRAAKYIDKPLGWVSCWERVDPQSL
jgi:hypothetical protein